METRHHLRLKQLALAWLRERGYLVASTEVRCPISRFRVDAAGWSDGLHATRVVWRARGAPESAGRRSAAPESTGRRRGGRRGSSGRDAPDVGPRTILIECKQSRADFLRDRRDRERLLKTRDALLRVKTALERDRIRAAEPDLRRQASLFSELPETEDWNYAASRLPAYRELLRKLRRIDRLIHGETKFHMTARYALADHLFIAAPRGLLRPRELPPGWGLLECPERALRQGETGPDIFGESVLIERKPAPPMRSTDRFRERLYRNIAVSASAAAARAAGVR